MSKERKVCSSTVLNQVSLISENTDKQGKAVSVLLTILLFSRLPTVILKPRPPSSRIPGVWLANEQTGLAHLPQLFLTDTAQKKNNKYLMQFIYRHLRLEYISLMIQETISILTLLQFREELLKFSFYIKTASPTVLRYKEKDFLFT